jgi:hypothetical protein
VIKSRAAAGLRGAGRYAGESALFRGHVVCGPTSSLRVVIGAEGRGRVDLTREGMGCADGRTATRWRIASGLVAAAVLLLHNSATQCASKSPPTVLWSMSSRIHTVTT